jgi:hypothetical protein
MHQLLYKDGTPAAYLVNNTILNIHLTEVIGLVLGNCVFGKNASVVGKLFKQFLRTDTGEKVAALQPILTPLALKITDTQLAQQSWQIIQKIQTHTCGWIEEKDAWKAVDMESLLNGTLN